MSHKPISVVLALILTLALPAAAFAAPGGSPPGSSSSSTVRYSGATTITSAASQSGKTYASTTADQNALLISTSDAVTIANPTVTKSGDSDGGDNCNFYGINSGIMVKGGTTTTITGGTVTATAKGANGVFSYGGNGGTNGAAGDGTTVVISDTTINTTGDNGGGIMTTGGGIMKASNLTVTTSGSSSAAIRTDRGGGTVTVNGGSYTSSGLGSPAIYSTADITVSDATLVSKLSEGVCIEGKNSVTLTDCDLTASNTKCNGNATFLDTIMIYQSMSGDADSGTSTFTMSGGSLTSNSGHVFHVTNTNAVITLSDVTINNNDSDNVLLSVCDDGWSGASNIATLNASGQTMTGTILVGSDSTLTLKLTNGSVYTGKLSGSITNAKGSSVSSSIGTTNVTLDSTSKWYLTGDTYVSSFSGTAANVINNGYTLYVNGSALAGTTDSDDSGSSGSDSGAVVDETTGFTDVNTGSYYYDAVVWAVENEVTSGTSDTTFSPNEDCTRAQVVTFLWRAAGSPEPGSADCAFGDVSSSGYYYKAVLWAVENGITTGTSGSTFSPSDTCTRGQIVTFLNRYAGSPSVTASDCDFTDVADSAYYYDAVLWAVENGITLGTSSTTFSPDDTCTRGQVVTFLYRYMV